MGGTGAEGNQFRLVVKCVCTSLDYIIVTRSRIPRISRSKHEAGKAVLICDESRPPSNGSATTDPCLNIPIQCNSCHLEFQPVLQQF